MSPAPSETLAVVCPRCGAMVDEPCVDERGRPVTTLHTERPGAQMTAGARR